MPGLRFVSYGGGVQSTALLVLAARGVIDFPAFVMSNVGDDSEHPETLAYVRNVAMPYAAANGIDLHLIERQRRDGETETLWGRLMRDGSRSLPIPVRMSNGAPGTRSCTVDFKIKVTGKWAKQHGATGGRSCDGHVVADCSEHRRTKSAGPCRFHPDPDCAKCRQPNKATVGIGISVDEIHRANNRRAEPHETIAYPLLDLRLRRDDCMRIIASEGLPIPPKSSCFFCPFHRPAAWQDLARETPELFEKSCQLEDTLNARRAALGKDPVYLTRFGVPLRHAIALDQDVLPPDPTDGECDSGYCFT